MIWAEWMEDYDNHMKKHNEKNTERAIKDLAYEWIEFNDYEKQAFKQLIKREGERLEYIDKINKRNKLQYEIDKLKEDLK